jgi:chloramphenicol 3-O-phosphotransferase
MLTLIGKNNTINYGRYKRMKLIILIGNSSVGKMTVGQELTKITDLKLFYNHMSIELVLDIFGTWVSTADRRIREVIFEEFAKSENYGLIFTFMWAFDQKADWDYISQLCDIFRKENAEIFYIELVASQEIRLKRNITENRLKNKASKRDIETSNQRLINDDKRYRCVSYDGEVPFENYMKIDNSELSPEEVARMIKEKYKF